MQLATRRWILEASLQIPVVQSLRGAQLEQDFTAVVSVRVPFALPW